MKKTMLSFLCVTAACMGMAQQPASSDPKLRNTAPSGVTQPNTINNSRTNTTQQPPVNTNNGAVNGHNTIMNGDRSYPGNNNLNNTQPNPTMNSGNSTPASNPNMNSLNEPMNSGTLSATTSSAAYSVTVPASVQTSFQAAYPAVTGNVIWSQSGDWYTARYMDNGRIMESSYREDGKTFTRTVSPLMHSYVPEEVLAAATSHYGVNLYSITQSKGAGGDVYNVTIIENGQSRTEWINADGSMVANPYRTEEHQVNTDMKQSNESSNTAAEAQPQVTGEQPTNEMNNAAPLQPANEQMENQETVAPATEQPGTEEGNETMDPDNSMNQEAVKPDNTMDIEREGNYSPEEDPYYYYY